MLRGGPSRLSEPDLLTPEQIKAVRQSLKKVLVSHAFAGSKRTQDFLQLIVGHALEGEIDSLRERMIGAEMFGRPVSYDTGSDSVVRVRASDARKKLAQYYSEMKEEKPEVRIELPSGSYVPRFHFEPLETHAPTAPKGFHSVSAELPSPAPYEEQTVASPEAKAEPARAQPKKSIFRAPWVLPGVLVGLVVIAFIANLGIRQWSSAADAKRGIRSIAILPLENLSGVPAQEYFADGMTEELINDLGQVSTLRVISLTSSMSYKGTKKKLPDIARELAVDGIVEGSVLREGTQVRISAQLIDARTDRPVWAHSYDRDLSSVLAWQGEVAQAIAEEISIKVTPEEQARLARKRLIDPEAQDLYLHGILRLQADDCRSAIDYLTKAIEKNPNYAQAHAALASSYGRMGESGRMPYKEAFTRQKAEAVKAIELDDSLSEGHAELGNTAMTLDWDWPAAAVQFHRALELNPNSASIRQKYAFYLVRTGQLKEALAQMERGVDLDPVAGSTFHAEGFIYYFSRQYDQALAVTRTVQGLKINPPDWSFLLGDIYVEKGMYAESIAEFLKAGNDPYPLGHLGNAYARAGRADAARRIIAHLEEHVRTTGVGRYEIALVYAGLGRKKDAFKWLEESYNAHDVGLVYLKVDPCLDPLRSDLDFDALMRRVGFTQ